MARDTKIEWAHHTFNPWIGCTKVSPACKHCYAERDFDHHYGKVSGGGNGTRVLTSEAYWKKPLKWNREAESSGIRARVFCASLADVFEDWDGPIINSKGERLWIDTASAGWLFASKEDSERSELARQKGVAAGTMNDVRKRLFTLIDATPNLNWLLLGPVDLQNIQVAAEGSGLGPDQLSDDLHDALEGEVFSGETGCVTSEGQPTVDWVVAGGESGPEARPTDPQWFRSIREQCKACSVPILFKQLGEPDEFPRSSPSPRTA